MGRAVNREQIARCADRHPLPPLPSSGKIRAVDKEGELMLCEGLSRARKPPTLHTTARYTTVQCEGELDCVKGWLAARPHCQAVARTRAGAAPCRPAMLSRLPWLKQQGKRGNLKRHKQNKSHLYLFLTSTIRYKTQTNHLVSLTILLKASTDIFSFCAKFRFAAPLGRGQGWLLGSRRRPLRCLLMNVQPRVAAYKIFAKCQKLQKAPQRSWFESRDDIFWNPISRLWLFVRLGTR